MEHITNSDDESDEGARSNLGSRNLAMTSDVLPSRALQAEIAAQCGRPVRHDGWTPERIRTFLNALAENGIVAEAAAAAGMSVRSAYNLRNRANGRAFHLAWNAALLLARRRLADELLSRAIHGCRDVTIRNGTIWSERHRHDNWLTLTVLNRLDRKFEHRSQENFAARVIADEFDEFVDVVTEGGAGASKFLGARNDASVPNPETKLLDRLGTYLRTITGQAPAARAGPGSRPRAGRRC